jgi:hypothetical protein
MKKALVVMAVVSGAYATYRWTRSDDVPAAPADARDRVWIDHLPRNDRDMVQVFIAITDEPIGLFQNGSQWKQVSELFLYEGHGDELRIRYPQTGEKEQVRATARTCRERDMDYCLELSGNSRGVKRYYSRKGWEVGGTMTRAQLERRTAELVEQL